MEESIVIFARGVLEWLHSAANVVITATPSFGGGLGVPMLHMAGMGFFLLMSWWFFETHEK